MSFNYYVRDPAGTSIPVSLKMKQDCWLSTPRSLTFVADLWPATSVIMSLLVLPFSSDRRSYQSVLGAYIHVYLSLSCNENTWCFTILQGEQKEKTKKKKTAKPVITIEGSYGSSITYLHGQEANLSHCRYSQWCLPDFTKLQLPYYLPTTNCQVNKLDII